MKTVLSPPLEVKHMVCLNKEMFNKILHVVHLTVSDNMISDVMKSLKKHMLCMRNLKNIRMGKDNKRYFLLNPDTFTSVSLAKDTLTKEDFAAKLEAAEYGMCEVEIGYDNWSAEEILNAILPEDIPHVTGFSIVGHVAHLNLKEVHSPYKSVIGQVLLDKHKNLKSVVNKTDSIDNTFRNFVMELLAGEDNMNVMARENGCIFKFDFSKVYWNSRLGTEHERIIAEITPQTLVFDVFAGVGPFSVPAAKKGATVYCNDLNHYSYVALCENLKINKVTGKCYTHNLDGRKFIETIVKDELLNVIKVRGEQELVVIMNLPALAIEFLDSFVGLLNDAQDLISHRTEGVKVYCYCFSKVSNYGEDVAKRINNVLATEDDNPVTAAHCRKVRNVAPNKDMICAQFYISWATMSVKVTESEEVECKKQKLDDS